jgi:dTDP-4-dehydrorhamnose reductase
MLVTGSGGMVGRAVCEHCHSLGDRVVSYSHQDLDVGDFNTIMKTLRDEQPDVVINCAAWTDVDGCELQPELAYETNAQGPENLATACREIDAVLVTISTDYVFDGRKEGFYTQRDQPNPESVYAMSKLEGERRAQEAYVRTIVVRTGFIFGPGGTNFLSTLVDRARRGEKITAITDAYGTPTYSLDLAMRLRELSELDLPGVYHVVNQGEGVSFAEFARQAIEIAGCDDVEVQLVSMDSLKRAATRPRNSRLRCLLSEAIGLPALRDWRSALREYLEQPVTKAAS